MGLVYTELFLANAEFTKVGNKKERGCYIWRY